MPAQSKKQQQFMGMVHAVQTGKLDPSKVSSKVKKTAKGMTKKAAKDFASTKHDNLPEKSKNEESIRNAIREIIIDTLNEEYSIMTGKFINDLEKFLALQIKKGNIKNMSIDEVDKYANIMYKSLIENKKH